MLRSTWQYRADGVVQYLSVADYYATSPGELLGEGYEHLPIEGMQARDVFESLAHNLNPQNGELLRPHAKDGDRVGVDFTFNAPKSVSIARELAGTNHEGDPLIELAHREAVGYTLGYMEKEMMTRVKGGREDSRVTGNLMAYRVTHRDTRINKDDLMPDMSLHDHVFVLNTTFDPVEKKWKAAEIAQIKHDACYYEAIYHNRLAGNLRRIGYGIEKKGKSFEIAGVSEPLIKKFSRRRQEIVKTAKKLGITSPEGMAKLGATTRLGKTKETESDLQKYYVSRLTQGEKQALARLEGQPSYECSHDYAAEYAIGHIFERQSIVEEKKLHETALRFGIGSVTPEGIGEACRRQGVITKDRQASTKGVLAQEGRVIQFAREGRGTMRPLGHKGQTAEGITLSVDQQAVVDHVLTSTDQLILVRGAAGTGKTTALKSIINGLDRQYAMLAPSSEASRGVLRREGFKDANTVAHFIGSEESQRRIRNGVIFVDEAGLLPIKDLDALCRIAERERARVILLGDPLQHRSVSRDGNMFTVLQNYAGLPVAGLVDIKRQKGMYREAVKAIDSGNVLKGYDILDELGYIQHTDNLQPVIDDYIESMRQKKSALIISPTNAECDELNAGVRARLKEGVQIGRQAFKLGEEKTFDRLVPLAWTEAQKGDAGQYQGDEVVQFFRSSGPFRPGQRITVDRLLSNLADRRVTHFAVYRPGKIDLAVGDRIRITTNGTDITGRHRLENGSVYTVAGFTQEGNIALTNGWTVSKGFGHFNHAYASTSHGSQGKTTDRVLIAMGRASIRAISNPQFYVSVSRGRERCTIYHDMAPEDMRRAIQKIDPRKSATELFKQSRMAESFRVFREMRLRSARSLREREKNDMREHEQGNHYGR